MGVFSIRDVRHVRHDGTSCPTLHRLSVCRLLPSSDDRLSSSCLGRLHSSFDYAQLSALYHMVGK